VELQASVAVYIAAFEFAASFSATILDNYKVCHNNKHPTDTVL